MAHSLRRTWDAPFAVELLLLICAAPALYVPGAFPPLAIVVSLSLLGFGWVWRRWTLGYWMRRTPADWPLFFLFVIMLPISLWAAPAPLREEYSIPRAYILVWNLALFCMVVTHASREEGFYWAIVGGYVASGVLVAAVGFLATPWPNKLPVLSPLLSLLPSRLIERLPGAESGLNPNQVAGALLFVLLPVVMTALQALAGRRWFLSLALMLASLFVGGVLVATQSRAALLGLAVGLAVMVSLRWHRGPWVLAGGLLMAGALGFFLFRDTILGLLDVDALAGTNPETINMAGRVEIWSRAIYGIQDFPFTGMGLGAFREIVRLLYPLFTISPTFDIGHAHNFFLQSALDFGLPGLIAVLAIYLVVAVSLIQLWQRGQWQGRWRLWTAGLIGTLVAQTTYSMVDAVSMGAKPNFLLWYFWALTLALLLLPYVPALAASSRKAAKEPPASRAV